MTDSSAHIIQNKAWYFLSIYYSRDQWAELISQIMQFYSMRQKQFCNCLVSLSEEKGEHIQVTFISLDCKEDYQNEIAGYFQSYINTHPSSTTKPFPYGQAIWCNYENNTLVWDKFRLWDHTEQYIRFHQKTFQLALKLLENDFSDDSIFSLAIYLFTKGLLCIPDDEKGNTLSRSLKEVSTDIENYNFGNVVGEIFDKINVNEINDVIESYIQEKGSDYSQELTDWMDEVKILLTPFNYTYFGNLICHIIGLTGMQYIITTGLRQLVILELMNVWYNSR